ncbi:1904_t:CDS:2, partial [Dentiscutata heterogama]
LESIVLIYVGLAFQLSLFEPPHGYRALHKIFNCSSPVRGGTTNSFSIYLTSSQLALDYRDSIDLFAIRAL